jgi:hypothetical protein
MGVRRRTLERRALRRRTAAVVAEPPGRAARRPAVPQSALPRLRHHRRVDLRRVDRQPEAAVASLVLGLICSRCGRAAPMPRLLGRHALPPNSCVPHSRDAGSIPAWRGSLDLPRLRQDFTGPASPFPSAVRCRAGPPAAKRSVLPGRPSAAPRPSPPMRVFHLQPAESLLIDCSHRHPGREITGQMLRGSARSCSISCTSNCCPRSVWSR